MKQCLMALALFGLATFAGAKSYGISLDSVAKVGQVELQPGHYNVKLQGTEAVFTDRTGRKYEVPAKVETGKYKFDYTAVEMHRANGMERIDGIDLSGTRTTLAFN